MTLVKHELRLGWKAAALWTAGISAFLIICVVMFPEMASQMKTVNKLFASMGAFTAAFGMDRLNFGTLIGFYGVECGSILGIGGAMYASLTASNLLCREERDRTAGFLLTHPVTRAQVVTGKLLSLLAQTVVMNLVLYLVAVGTIAAIGLEIPWRDLTMLHLAYFLVQIELEGICLGISAFLRRSGIGLGIGLAIAMYFLNILGNLQKDLHFLKYLTPFGFADSADILSGGIPLPMLALGMGVMLLGIAAAYWQYCRKDIH